jgi:hypothetical protein
MRESIIAAIRGRRAQIRSTRWCISLEASSALGMEIVPSGHGPFPTPARQRGGSEYTGFTLTD